MRGNPTTLLVALLALGACKGETITKIETHTVANTVTNTVTNTVPVTKTVTITNTTGQLQPGHFDEVLVETQRLQDNAGVVDVSIGDNSAGEDHMHLSEIIYRPASANEVAQMMYCAYTFGVLDATNPANMPFQAQGFRHAKTTGTKEPGCIHLTADDNDRDLIFTTHHGGITDGLGFLSGWDLHAVNDVTDANLDGIPDFPTKVTLAPTEIPKLTETDMAYEGVDTEKGLVWVARHEDGLGVYSYDKPTQIFTPVSTYTDVVNSWDIKVVGDIAYLCDGAGGLVTLDVSDPLNPVYMDRVVFAGEARDIDINGNYAYVAAESGGIATVDISDPHNLAVVGGISGISAIALDYDSDNLFVAAWDDARVYNAAADPLNPPIIGAARQEFDKEYTLETTDESRPNLTDRVLAMAGTGNYMFDGTWHVPYSFQLYPDRVAPYIVVPEDLDQLTFPGDIPLGGSTSQDITLRNDGTADLTIYDIWTDSPAFIPSVNEMLIHPGESQTLTLTFSPTIGYVPDDTSDTATPPDAQETTLIHFDSDDPQQPIREGYLVGNPDAIGVGDAFPEMDVTLNDGTSWTYTDDALGSVTMVLYFATF